MHTPEEAPPLKPWPFLAGDVVLIATAFFIATQASAPLGTLPLIAITTCVCLGAILAIIPFVLNHTHKQDLALADRQREISALAQTTANSAEQISIAATNLHSIVEHAGRAIKLGETLPHKMQEKINDFKTQLNEVAVTENEALSQEINTLRTSETERLETALAGVRKISAELSSLEASAHKHLAELNDSLSHFTTEAGKSAAEAAKSIDAARVATEKSLASSQAAALSALQASVTAALASLEQKFTSLAEKSSELIAKAKIAPPQTIEEKNPAPKTEANTSTAPAANPRPPSPPSNSPLQVPISNSTAPLSKPATTPPLEIQTTTSAPSSEISNIKSSVNELPPPRGGKTDAAPPSATRGTGTAAPAAASHAPLFSQSASPFAVASTPAAEDVPSTLLTEEKPVRKRAPRKPTVAENELTLGIELPEPANEFSQIAPDDAAPAVSADGLTRLIVTAYIGIGNKLFARGEGPGLSWDRGVPLQFVSIGKWRWESADASAPVRLKLYKNDSLECASVGTLTITPGHQHEVTANFN